MEARAAAEAAGGGGGRAAAAHAASSSGGVTLRHAATRDELRTFAELTREYYHWLGEDLCFQGIDGELASLPGCYAAPTGTIIVAYSSASPGDPSAPPEPLGCVAVRPLPSKGDGEEGGNGGAVAANGDKSGAGGGGQGDAPEACDPPAPGPTCEMKRLWVRDAGRGAGVGRALVAGAVEAGRRMGYRSIVLDTLERLEAANKIYETAGFRRRGAYYHNPLPNVVYWELDL